MKGEVKLGITRASVGLIVSAWLSLPIRAGTADSETVERTSGRTWAVSDSVALTYFDPETISISPDGEKFSFRTVRGDVSCDCNVFQLTVFSASSVQDALINHRTSAKPLGTLVRRSSEHHGPEIFGAHWEPDGSAINFVGLNKDGVRQLYLWSFHSGAVTQLTNWPYGVGFPFRVGDTTMSNVSVPTAHKEEYSGYPLHSITRKELDDLYYPQDSMRSFKTFISYRGGAPWGLKTTTAPYARAITGDGRRLVDVRLPEEIPPRWATYDNLSIDPETGHPASVSAPQFVLIDAEKGTERALFDAPAGVATKVGNEFVPIVGVRALWARGEKHLILINTTLPLEAQKDSERSNMAYIADYDVGRNRWSVIEPLRSKPKGSSPPREVSEVGWFKEGEALLVRHAVAGKAISGTVYTLHGDRWNGAGVTSDVRLPADAPVNIVPLAGGISVDIRQSANEPPVVIASNGHNEIALTTKDSVLDGVSWARQEPFKWKAPGGRENVGGLLLPKDPHPHTVPLVIQGYMYSPNRFLPDGPETHAYAAQTLVARGMAVLNVTIPGTDSRLGTLPELLDYSSLVESASNELARLGVIDRRLVGLIGFSRAGYETYYVITHPGSIPPAAAVIDDGFPGTYTYNLTLTALGSQGGLDIYGGSFWQHKSAWLEHETSFNVDRVKTPALFTVHNKYEIPVTLDTMGAFMLNGRPFEYLVFPEGNHGLEMPLERLASLEASVDWMAFWLQDYEDPSPRKQPQYARWRILRQEQMRPKDAGDATAN